MYNRWIFHDASEVVFSIFFFDLQETFFYFGMLKIYALVLWAKIQVYAIAMIGEEHEYKLFWIT